MAATCPITFDVAALREHIRAVYTRVADGRVLRPGGGLYLADVVVQRELILRARSEPDLRAACIGGAPVESELHTLAAEAGLVETTIHGRFSSFAGTSAETKVAADLQIGAVQFSARVRS